MANADTPFVLLAWAAAATASIVSRSYPCCCRGSSVTDQPPIPAVQAGAAIHGDIVAFTIGGGLFLVGMVFTGLLLRSGRLPTTTTKPPLTRGHPDLASHPWMGLRRLDCRKR
jgi:hypothetical protein